MTKDQRRRLAPERRIGAVLGGAGVADVACWWHDNGMARTRLSTTVNRDLLEHARRTRIGVNDAELIDEALGALVAQHRAAEIDAAGLEEELLGRGSIVPPEPKLARH